MKNLEDFKNENVQEGDLLDFPYCGSINIIVYKTNNGEWTYDGYSGGGNWDDIEHFVAKWGSTQGYRVQERASSEIDH